MFTLKDAGRRGAEVYALRLAKQQGGFSALLAETAPAAEEAAAAKPELPGTEILQTYIPGALLLIYVPAIAATSQAHLWPLDAVMFLAFLGYCLTVVFREQKKHVLPLGTYNKKLLPKFPFFATGLSFVAYSMALRSSVWGDIPWYQPVIGTAAVALVAGFLYALGPGLEKA